MEEIDIKQLVSVIWNKKVQILIIALIFFIIGGIYTSFFTTPKYKSKTTLLLANSNSASESASVTQTDVNLNQKLVTTYSELIKSDKISRKVIANLGLNMSENALKSSITVTSVKSTEIIKIEVVNKDASIAAKVANEIANVFSEEVKNIYKIDNIYVVDVAEEETVPYNINHMKDIVIFTGLGLVIALGYIFLAFMLDTTVKTVEDIEKNLGLTVLVTIPVVEETAQKGGRR